MSDWHGKVCAGVLLGIVFGPSRRKFKQSILVVLHALFRALAFQSSGNEMRVFEAVLAVE